MWKKLNFTGKLIVALILSIITTIMLGQAMDLSVDFQTVLCFILAFVYIILLNVKVAKKNAAIRESIKDVAIKNGDGVLFVKKRAPAFNKALKCESDNMYSMEHEDAQYIYTSATVGGITTGGVTKIGDRDFVQVSSTGKCNLVFCDDYIVKKIQLNTELWEAAKKSSISKYLEYHTRSIVVVNTVTPSIDVDTLAKEDPSLALKKMQMDMRSGYPTKQKCKEIINWLSCNN